MGDISKLPKWAQKHIEDLEGRRKSAEKALFSSLDNQKESVISYTEFINTNGKNTFVKNFVQSRSVDFNCFGLKVAVYADEMNESIRISFSAGPYEDEDGKFKRADAVVVPQASNMIKIVRVKQV